MLEFECPHCNEILNIPEQFVGTAGTCRKCGGDIAIEAQATHDISETVRPPALVAFHCETTGPSTRKCNITELAGVKFDLAGQEVDTFALFANPGHLIAPRISEKTGITDDMVATAPSSTEVVKLWFQWAGPNALLFSHHAHFNARFVCATLLKEELDPPSLRIIDALGWARHLDVPVEEYKLRSLLDYIGYRVKRAHRALETCHGVAALASYLTKRQIGTHNVASQSGVFGKLLGKTEKEVNSNDAYKTLGRLSRSLEDMCGDDFFSKVRDDPRRKRTRNLGPAAGMSVTMETIETTTGVTHRQEWFDERRGQLERMQHEHARAGSVLMVDSGGADAPWEYILLEASQCEDLNEQKRLCLDAVSLGARDAWPYSRLASIYIREKVYQAAYDICEDYFKTDFWKAPQWAESGLKILKRMEKLETKLNAES